MSYKVQIKVSGDPKFYDNAIRLATKAEAQAYGDNKLRSWTLAETYAVVETDDPVNYEWKADEGLVPKES